MEANAVTLVCFLFPIWFVIHIIFIFRGFYQLFPFCLFHVVSAYIYINSMHALCNPVQLVLYILIERCKWFMIFQQ
jgi:hypothetical protein